MSRFTLFWPICFMQSTYEEQSQKGPRHSPDVTFSQYFGDSWSESATRGQEALEATHISRQAKQRGGDALAARSCMITPGTTCVQKNTQKNKKARTKLRKEKGT